MDSGIINFILKYKYIILFYLTVIILAYINRKKIEVQAKIIFLYRMKWGLKWMDKYSSKYREWVILLGYIGVGAGFVGLVFISYMLIKNLYQLFLVPDTVSGVSLVLPGVEVPGLGILPFWHWIIAIFIIAIVHEFAHGIVARAHNIKVKNTGIVLFGPIIGAFVEPDEQNLSKQSDIKQYSVLAAGAFSNVLLAIVALILLITVFTPLQNNMVEPTGFTFDQYVNEDLPFAKVGIEPGTEIIGIDDIKTKNFQEFNQELQTYKPGEEVTIKTKEKDYKLTLVGNPDDSRKPFMGIKMIHNEFFMNQSYSTS